MDRRGEFLFFYERGGVYSFSCVFFIDEYEVDWGNLFVSILGFGVFSVNREKSWLYTLDFIFIIIIVMSLLGVFLGVTCVGLLFYCICFYSGLSFRSCITLENYNFEFYDGFKYKVKMNY